MIYLTNSLSELNKHPNTIARRTKTTQDRPEIVKSSIVLAILVSRERKSLPYAYDYILIGNLHHVKKDEMHTSAMIQSCNPEIVEVNSALKFAEVSWVHQKRLKQRPTHIFFPSGIQRPSVSIDRRLWY